jgi:hypothetical protein
MEKIIRYNIAEYSIILLIICYSTGNQQPDYPSITGILTILLLVWMEIKILGVLIGLFFQFVALVLLLALISEASEFPTINVKAIELVGVGSCLIALIAASGTVLIYKYGKHFYKTLIGE